MFGKLFLAIDSAPLVLWILVNGIKSRSTMRRLPLWLVFFGLLLLGAAFVYNVLFVGLPYQDPTPALLADYQSGRERVYFLGWSGAAILVLGVIGGIARLVTRKRKGQ
ncbi:MAG: hypothetical protein O7I42_25890 [Alphaproteobacteria bacterium]|nr:hypothetical protein [Alphaproteobacteria bacterium]